MYGNIIMSGGSTMYSGMPERLENDLRNLAPQNMEINVSAPNDRKFSVWIGGSILSSL